MLIDRSPLILSCCYQVNAVMPIALKILLATALLIGPSVESRRSMLIWNFNKEITVQGKVIIAASPLLTENESFVYAVCDNRNSMTYFIESHCNVTVEKPILPYVTHKRTCPIDITPDNIEDTENLTQLSISLLGDDKAVFTWLQISKEASMAKLKIVQMSSCRVLDVPIPVERIRFVVSYGNSLDVILHSKTYCSSPICKVTLNGEAQIVSEPTEILLNDQINHEFAALGPVADRSLDKGFYLSNRFTGDRSRLFRIASDGRAAEVTTFSIEKPYGHSATYGFLSLCDSFADTIACRTFDRSLQWTMDRTVEFNDKGLSRWLQPYNLKDGAVLLVTGRASDEKAQRFDHFSVFRLEANGQKHRKRLEVDHLNFHCESVRTLRVHVSESQADKICFYFSCAHKQLDQYKFQFAFKCYPKLYFGAAVPLTNACFLASGDDAITDFTIYA